MDALTDHDQQALFAQLAKARDKIDGLVRDLREVDAELDALATERRQHRLLHDVCGALEELAEIGGAQLFWGGPALAGGGEELIRRVRGRVDGFQKRLGEIEDRRQSVLDEIEQQQGQADWLEDEALELQEEEDRLDREWIVERDIGVLPNRELMMPWARGAEEDRRYRRSLTRSLAISLLIGVVAPQLELPAALDQEVDVPERVVRLMMEARPVPPPVAQAPVIPQSQHTPEPEAQPVAKQAKEGPGAGPKQGPGKGILAFRESFAGVAENQTIARLGSQARISSPGAAPSGVIERSMVATQAPGSSGGINLAELSRGVAGGGGGGGGRIERIQIARATSAIGGGGGRGTASVGGGGPPLGRTDEEIQIVFDRHKAGLYRLYNRELRNDPTLMGQMVLRMRIEPDGRVTLCELHASDMNAPQLAAQVLERVRGFDFGAKEGIPAITILYPIDFLPAT